MMYCPIGQLNLDTIGILFEIKIDSTLKAIPFASLDNISQFLDFEKEILFSMHTVFESVKSSKLKISPGKRNLH
jgi:hypothetical protein